MGLNNSKPATKVLNDPEAQKLNSAETVWSEMFESESSSTNTVLITKKVCLFQDHLAYGPLSLQLKASQGVLITCGDLVLMRSLMRCCQGFRRPHKGSITWWEGAALPGSDLEETGLKTFSPAKQYSVPPLPSRGNLWDVYDFYAQIGYVDRLSELIHHLPLIENLALPQLYARHPDPNKHAQKWLEIFGLEEYGSTLALRLPEPKRRLALYALALSRQPKILLVERPLQFLDRDFDLAWDIILRQTKEYGLAFMVFDRTKTMYAADHFQSIVSFNPDRF